jgi:hypothetical protein
VRKEAVQSRRFERIGTEAAWKGLEANLIPKKLVEDEA